jgi:phytoene desaturase
MPDYDVIVIGAGCGGITAAVLLAKQGRKTLLLEQSGRVGGCCSSFERDGYRFDVGASVVEVIQPIAQAFSELGTSLEKELDLIPCDPVMSTILPDGRKITFPNSIVGTGDVISSISPEDGRAWFAFVEYMRELVDVSLNTFFVLPAVDLNDMLVMIKKDPRLAKALPAFLTSYQAVLQKFFKNETVLKTMGYQSLYFGLPPALVPGPYAMIPYTEHIGVYYPRGGMIQIPQAFRRVGEALGLQIRLNTRVQKVLIRDGQAIGVRLADGAELTSRLVVSNINAKYLYGKLIGLEHLPPLARRGIQSYAYSKAVPMIYLGLDYAPPLEAHHSMIGVTPDEVNRYWWQNVEKGRLPDEPFGLMCWPTYSDPSLAPPGKHVINLIPEAFYRLEGTDWDTEKPAYIERTLKYFSKFAIPGLLDHIQVVDCATPLDFERQLLLPEGSIYSLQQDLPAMAVLRPAARSKSIRGLYLTGSSTHPGGGVPTTIASGLIAAHLIERFE